MNYEEQYLKILDDILKNGKFSSNRTGINTYKIWGAQMHIDLTKGFPLLTTKKMHWKSVVHELLWMISGNTNIQYLLKNGVTFWSEWPYKKYIEECGTKDCNTQKEFEKRIIEDDDFAKKWGSIGEFGYGGMWRNFPFWRDVDDSDEKRYVYYGAGCVKETHIFGYHDQLTHAIEELKTNPDSRRIIVSSWHSYHSNRIKDALLPACHNYIQFGTEELSYKERNKIFTDSKGFIQMDHKEMDYEGFPRYKLNCYYSMRSNDFFLGAPFNNAFYGLLTHLIANHLNMVPNKLVYSGVDVHLYENHIEQAKLQMTRTPRNLPKVNIESVGKSIFDIKYEDIELIGYDPYPSIKAEVAV